MNTAVLFLLGAVALSALGGMVVWAASRPRKERFGSTVDSFNQNLEALAPPGQRRQRAPQVRRAAPHGAPGMTSTHKDRAVAQPSGQGEMRQAAPRPRPGPTPRRSG